MSNYPDNVSPNDPRAPWNAVEPNVIDCEECGGTGVVPNDDPKPGEDEAFDCEECGGTGTVEEEIDEDF